jgi:hypothetical protein
MTSETEDGMTGDAMTAGDARSRGSGIRAAEKGADQGTGQLKAEIAIATGTGSGKTEEGRTEIEIVITVVAERNGREVAAQTDTDLQRVVLGREQHIATLLTDSPMYRSQIRQRSRPASSSIKIPLPSPKWRRHSYSNTVASQSSTV